MVLVPGILRLSEAVSLAMHAMVYLAASGTATRRSAKEIARDLRVSEHHLSKVLQRLSRAGLVVSYRGPRGGFTLARPDITLFDVYRAIEGDLPSDDCLFAKRVCRGARCILGSVIKDVNRDVTAHLRNTKLSDLCDVYQSSSGLEPRGPDRRSGGD